MVDQILHTVEIGPNPAADEITLNFEAVSKVNVGVSLFDFTGRAMINDQFTSIKGHNEHKVNIHEMSNGVYLVQVETPNGIITKPIVIMNDE